MAPSTSVLPAARYLFYALEDASAQGLSKDELEKLLGESGDFLCGCLGSYSPPSAASKSAVESGTVSYGGKSLKLTESIRKVTIAASAKLALNEVQTYAMLRRCVDEDKLETPTECDDDLVERLTTFYFRERLSLLKCVHQLFVRAIDAQEDDLSAPMRACLERLLRDGLEENLVASLCAHARGETPARPGDLPPFLAREWARQSLEELKLMLECVFLMYYDQNTKCTSTRFAQLASAFEAGALGRAPAASAELVRHSATVGGDKAEAQATAHVVSMADSLRALCVVILVEALDLEGAADRIQGQSLERDSGEPHAMLREGALGEVAKALEGWPSDAVHGPVLLAWATLLALAPSAAAAEGASLRLPSSADPAAAATRAASGDAGFGSLRALLRLDFLRSGGGVSVTLHKSVLKNLLTATLAAFDILPAHKLRPSELGTLLDVLEELAAGQPILCEQFWGGAQSDGLEAPLLSLLVGCQERHPADAAPLLRALAALSEGPRAAECALAFLSRLPTVALPAPAGDVESAGAVLPVGPDGHVSREWEEAMEAWREDREAWSRRRETGYARDDAEPPPPPPLPPGTSRAASALASPYLPGACVPRGTHGRAIPRPGTSVEPVAEEQEEADDDDAAMTAAGGPGATAPTADIVAWNAPADGVRILVARLCVLSVAGCAPGGATVEDAAELDASLDFVRRVLTSAPSFAAKLAACDATTSVSPGTPDGSSTLSPRSSPAPRPPARRGRRFRARAASGALRGWSARRWRSRRRRRSPLPRPRTRWRRSRRRLCFARRGTSGAVGNRPGRCWRRCGKPPRPLVWRCSSARCSPRNRRWVVIRSPWRCFD